MPVLLQQKSQVLTREFYTYERSLNASGSTSLFVAHLLVTVKEFCLRSIANSVQFLQFLLERKSTDTLEELVCTVRCSLVNSEGQV